MISLVVRGMVEISVLHAEYLPMYLYSENTSTNFFSFNMLKVPMSMKLGTTHVVVRLAGNKPSKVLIGALILFSAILFIL